MEFFKTSGIVIPKIWQDSQFYCTIKAHLTRTVRDFTGVNFTTIKFYSESEKFLKIPRFFPIEDYIDCEIIDKSCEGQDIEIEHNITLRDDLQKNVVEYLLDNENGIVQADPGSGKTVMMSYMIATRKKKTIVLVHKDSLVDQWRDRLLEFTNLSKDDISRLRSDKFEEDLKKKIIICTDQTFISLLKRKPKEFLTALNEANIGIFVGDEVHTSVGAPAFGFCSMHIPCRYVYGLSATPYRNDGNSDIITYHLGEVYEPDDKSSTMDARVTILLMSYGILSSKSRAYVYWNRQLNRARYLNMLKNSKSLENLSISLIERFLKEKRKIIYVTDRIKHMDILFKKVKHDSKSKFISGSKNVELEKDITFSTTGKIRDGVDAASKDCLILTLPVSNIKQMTGRVLRQKEGKEIPIIIDIVDIDDLSISATVIKRIKFYKSKGWKINYLFADSQTLKVTELSEQDARKKINHKTENEKVYDSIGF